MSGDYVITLVHGTWARKASWADENSVLCRGLRDQLQSSLLAFERFQWSGRNLFSARRNASHRLVAHIKQMSERWPNARHYIIAHSHGGNIALYALRDDEVNRVVTGVVCLATPFLHARPRNLGSHGKEDVSMMMALFFGGLMGLLIGVLTETLFPSLGHWLDEFASLRKLVFWLPAIAMVGACFWLTSRWAQWGDRLLRELAFPDLDRRRLLIVRTVGDEAQAALAGTQAIGWVSMRIWRPLSALTEKAENARGWRKVALGQVPMVLQLLTSLLLIPTLVLVSVLMGAFAPDLVLVSPFIDMAIEATPQGSWVVHQLPSGQDHRLSHGQSYNDPRTVTLVAEWLNSSGTAVN